MFNAILFNIAMLILYVYITFTFIIALTPLIGGVSSTAFVVVLLVVLVITAIILVQRHK